MNFFKISGILLALFFSVVLMSGLTGESKSTISAEIAIDAPQPVVLRVLDDNSAYAVWHPYVNKVISKSRRKRQTIYQIGNRQFVLTENVRMDHDENCVCFESADSFKHAYLYRIKQFFFLRSLPDGSSEVRYKLTYRTASIPACLFNYLFLKRKISSIAEGSLSALKAYIQG